MSSPEKDELLEEFASTLGMTDDEMIRFCVSVLKDKGYRVTPDSGSDGEVDVPDYVKFRRDMAIAGYEVQEYHGRNHWKGPAVYTDEQDHPTRQDVIRATSVVLQQDAMGKHYVVYPQKQEEEWD